MRTLIDNSTGTTVFIPDTDTDRMLLYHIMNCTDMSLFSDYLALQQKSDNQPVTLDTGVSADMLADYPVCTAYDKIPFLPDSETGCKIKSVRPITTPPDYEIELFALLTDLRDMSKPRLIGFDRDSSHEGYRFKRRPV